MKGLLPAAKFSILFCQLYLFLADFPHGFVKLPDLFGDFRNALNGAVKLDEFVFDTGVPKIKLDQVVDQVRVDYYELARKH